MPLDTELTSETVVADSSCEHIIIRQGDAYRIPVTISLDDEPLGGEDIELLDLIEYSIGPALCKTIAAADAWNSEDEKFLLPVIQEETLRVRPGVYDFGVRVKFAGGDVIGWRKTDKVHVLPGPSRKVI